MYTPVPSYGPLEAPLLVIGEAGGTEEAKHGRPFAPSGASGRKLRGFIKAAGLDPDAEVRWTNVIPYAMPSLPKQQSAVIALTRQHWDHLATEFKLAQPKVILVVGRAALYRVMGLTRITDHACNAWPAPGGMVNGLPIDAPDVPVVATIHPAAVMRTKLEAGWTLVARACEKAVELTQRPFDHTLMNPSWEPLETYDDVKGFLKGAEYIWIDTEFDTRNGRCFLVGLATERSSVVGSARVNGETVRALQDSLVGQATKVFHHAPADLSSLLVTGIDVKPPFICNLRLHALVWPDLPVGLSKVSSHLLTDVHDWKWMARNDPGYNAIDVALTKRDTYVLEDEATKANVWDVWEREARHVMVLFAAMEARGLAVGAKEQSTLVAELLDEIKHLEAIIANVAGDVYAKRSEPVQLEHDTALALIARAEAHVVCEEHKYNGLTAPRGKKKLECETCSSWWGSPGAKDWRAAYDAARKARTTTAAKLKRWSTGFNPANNDHVRWLLYDKDALKLPVQKKDGAVTANADAVAKIQSLAKVRKRKDFTTVIEPLLAAIKDLQHAKKMISTFALWDVKENRPRGLDRHGVAHPEYRDYGAGTGRPAGGSDDDLSDKRGSAYTYNAMNIPKDMRVLYVPHKADYVPDVSVLVRNEVDDFVVDGDDTEAGDDNR